MHLKKKITVEELAGTCTSSSTIHGYLDELKRRNSISFEICPSINKKPVFGPHVPSSGLIPISIT